MDSPLVSTLVPSVFNLNGPAELMILYVIASPSLSVAEMVIPLTVVSAAEFSLTVPV